MIARGSAPVRKRSATRKATNNSFGLKRITMNKTQQRALFDAVKADDLEGVKRFFYDPSMAPTIARISYGSLLADIVYRERLDVLRWLVSAEACELIADMLRGLVDKLSTKAIRAKSMEALEILLDSYLFSDVLSPSERKLALESMQKSLLSYRWDNTFLRILIAHGADVENFPKQKPYQLHPLGAPLEARALSFYEELRRSGVNGLRFTTLGRQIWFEDVNIARTLMGLELDVRGDLGDWSPLHSALMTSPIEMIETIITHGFVDINAPGTLSPYRPNDGTTPLHARIAKDLFHKEMSEDELNLLFSYGADPYIKNTEGKSPYDMLMEHEIGRAYVNANPRWFPNRPQEEDPKHDIDLRVPFQPIV